MKTKWLVEEIKRKETVITQKEIEEKLGDIWEILLSQTKESPVPSFSAKPEIINPDVKASVQPDRSAS